MMGRNRTILVLFGVLLLLMGVIVGRAYWPEGDGESEAYAAHWSGLTPEGVRSLTIGGGENDLVVTRDGEWRVRDFLADGEAINDRLQNLIQPDRVVVVSETNQQHEDLGVSSEGGNQLRIAGEGAEVLVWVGNTTVDGRYLRFDGEDRVYLVDDLGFTVTSTEVNDWIEKVLLATDEEAISSIAVTQGVSTITLEQRDGQWYESGSETALNRDPLSGMINTLDSFMTQGLVPEEEMETLGVTPEITVEIARTTGEPVVLSFYAGEDDSGAVESSERSGRYAISASLMDNFRISADDLMAAEATHGEAE